MRKIATVVALVAATAVGCGTATTPLTPNPIDHRVSDNATALLPHQSVTGFYYWDGDEWMFRPIDSDVK